MYFKNVVVSKEELKYLICMSKVLWKYLFDNLMNNVFFLLFGL